MALFTPATRKQAKARIALAGPSGAGKTLTGLKLLYALTDARTVADGAERIAFIDTERDSADKYAVDPSQPSVGDMTPEQAGGYGFQKTSPVRYDPRELVTTIEEAARAGFIGLQVDSLSHYWFGAGGVLELVDLFTRNNGGRSMDGWRDVRPIERAYIEALMAFPGHVVVCLRSKQRYEIEEGNDGRKRVAKLGMQPDQREGLEFEFDVFGDLDSEHYLRISKTRCTALDGQVIHKPGQELGEQMLDWLAYGEPPRAIDWDRVLADCTSREDLAVWWQQAQRAGQSFALRDKFAARGQEISAARNGPATMPAEQTDSPPSSAQTPAEPASGAKSQQEAQDTAAAGRRPAGSRAKARAAEVAQ
ncbi:AAA family ATPase [Couchioplanes caeruleus]|uniref:AAA domain-containing protein n=2 Tax=Couchioplanes caeruleus TaxID=56438 RepID=A0A1K0GVG7_9ACTN|nr:AAA family ATPase [Couchioplanes caeruleus]OJF15380.1 hypothetical protein BG844_04575 [Couchioplanes caeruleus subsp. caeruleus]